MQNVRLSIAWLIAGVCLGALGFLLLMGQPFAAKAQEPKRFQYKIVEVLPDTQNMQTMLNEFGARRVGVGGGLDGEYDGAEADL